ncbi:helix-turn-helix domain-containing protein [Bradyrhizobium sp. 31Argb]|uniref:IclR family transcriptional regulator n=1 Tax=Bradyrhizobium sp. 31Argb TaxID=3141247 RepID=UPI003748389C
MAASEGVKSARRVLEILELFDRRKAPLSVQDVTDELGYPQSSASLILRTMTAMGYLYYKGSERVYRLNPRVALLGGWLNESLFHEGRISALMQDVSERTGQTVMLGIESRLRVQYVHIVEGNGAIRLHLTPGLTRALSRCSIGLIFLADRTDAEIRRLMQRLVSEDPSSMPMSYEELFEKIHRVRKLGYAISANLSAEGVGSISIKLPTIVSGRPICLAVGCTDTMLFREEARFVSILRDAAHQYFDS